MLAATATAPRTGRPDDPAGNLSQFWSAEPSPAWLRSAMIPLDFGKREIIFSMGDAADGVYFLARGRVKVYRPSEDGREITLAILDEGDIFGEEALMRPTPRTPFAEALEPTVVYHVERADFLRGVANSPRLAMRLLEITGHRLARAHQQVEDLAFRGVTSRIANLLLDMSREHGSREGMEVIVTPRLTHRQMASLVRTTRETLTATLSKLASLNLIRSSRRAVRIIDGEALAALI